MASAAPEIPALARNRAFEALYRQYVKDVYHYALALLRNPADAEDVTQTTFMNAYRAFKRGEHIEKPQNWLIKIAHNAARNRYAHASRRVREVPLDDHLDQLAVPAVERPNVKEVLDALGRLPLNQRGALVMRELEGRTYAEIAETLGVSVPAVETLIFRARRSLRLKASSIRVLGVVPVPGSLSHLLEYGGAAAGGGAGAAVGYGFLLKAAVAIVAGALTTGMNSDRPRQAEAATPPGTASATLSPTGAQLVSFRGLPTAGNLRTSGKRVLILVGDPFRTVRTFAPDAPFVIVTGETVTAPADRGGGAAGGAAGGGSAAASTVPATAQTATAHAPLPAANVTAPVQSTATQTVSNTVTTATTAVSAAAPIPVAVPAAPPPVPVSVSLPPSPVQLPPPPVSLPPPPPLPLP